MSYTYAQLLELYKLPLEQLKKKASDTAVAMHGKKVILRGLVEFSNECACDCLYCGIRSSNKDVHRYTLGKEQMLEAIQAGFDRGLRSFVIQSGEKTGNTKFLLDFIDAFRKQFDNAAALTVSCGIKSRDDYSAIKKAGADRYLLRFETSDPDLHKYMRNGSTLERRLQALSDIRSSGLQLGSGFMTGLPNETTETLINNVLLCQSLQMDMGGIGPFIPHPATPLASHKTASIELSYRATALLRLCLPYAHISATTAAGTLDPKGREMTIQCGANVLMPNITPVEAKPHYLLYPDKICLDESGIECMGCLSTRVLSVGRTISMTRGDSLRMAIANP